MAKIVISGPIYIYISFSTMKLFYLFTGRIVILEILDAPYVLLAFDSEHRQFWIPFHGENCNALCSFAYFSRNCDSIRISLKMKIVNDIGYLSSDRDCDITNDIMDSVSKWNVYLERWNSRFKLLKVRSYERIVNSE